ncbi:hypothetical protein DFQ07_1516 [Tenacibaculum caenipelagi]|uniref:Uncharacterized protein n=1 Tax=Tenacibaculum caenipelagi TaxID=1325435 RepID=A0A4R6TCW7_9FLAO|nr:hypothetical protein DFQ07_1516 [Tenacibaculum caenipelagi]
MIYLKHITKYGKTYPVMIVINSTKKYLTKETFEELREKINEFKL